MRQLDFVNVLTTGTEGALGSYIDFGIRTNRKTLDILDQAAVAAYVKEHHPSTIIHLAAATDTNHCEEDPSFAYKLNSVGTQNVALAAEAVGATMVYVSTSRVFDGLKGKPYTETDVPFPNTVYGKSKYLGEITTSLIASRYIIARGCWMFGGGRERDTKFFGNLIKQLNNEEIVALGDVYGSPTYAKDFVEGLKQLISREAKGIFHVCNTGFVTRSDIAAHIIATTGSKAKLKEVDRSYFPTGNLLPTNEAMESTEIPLRPWQEALSEYLKEEWLM